MGISDFYAVLKEHCPDVLITVNLNDLSGIAVAVDISIFLNKFVKTAGSQRWVDLFILLLCNLKKHGIKPVCIFDGPNPPPEKKHEQDRRRAEAAKKRDRIDQGKNLVKKIEALNKANKPIDDEVKDEVKVIIGPRRGKRQNVNYSDPEDILACLRDSVDKMEIQNLPILPEYAIKAKEIIQIMGFASFQADGEAEALCAGMCHCGLVDAVLSEDTDVLAIGAPYLLAKIDLSKQTVVAISYKDILDALEFLPEEFRDLCILLGCDYNERVKGYPPDGKNRKKPVSIGRVGAFHMINEYRRLEVAEQYMVDSDPLIYQRCRELFTPPDTLPDISIPYNRPIDQPALMDFLGRNGVKMSVKYILDTWKPVDLNFQYDEDVEEDEIFEEDILENDTDIFEEE